MARKVDISLLFVFVLLLYFPQLSNGSDDEQTKHHDKRAMGGMFKDILKSIKTNFVPGSKSKNQKGGDGGDGNAGGSSSGSWKNMIPDIAKAFIPDGDQDNSTSTEDMQDNDSSSNVTEVDPQATEVNAGVTENMGQDTKVNKQDSGTQDDISEDDYDTQASGKTDDKHDSKADNGSGEKQDKTTEKQNAKVNEGITENMGPNVDSNMMVNETGDNMTQHESITQLPTGVHDTALNAVHDNDKAAALSWEDESQEAEQEKEESEKQKSNDDLKKTEEAEVKVNAGVTENLGNDNVNPKPAKSGLSDNDHDVNSNTTVSTGNALMFEQSQPLSWESESPEVLEDEIEKERQTRR
ncbi:uncharacterized protein LOC132548077 [Ylistrum balloti]|uniref:uncharacterized protein LOC132548077 n=1 Tax=Ylistrum balloti TaxID=509963 RepID=UPI002905DA14|nr:uncharacterized protein LOC132548077 [Ylistrum balloti]